MDEQKETQSTEIESETNVQVNESDTAVEKHESAIDQSALSVHDSTQSKSGSTASKVDEEDEEVTDEASDEENVEQSDEEEREGSDEEFNEEIVQESGEEYEEEYLEEEVHGEELEDDKKAVSSESLEKKETDDVDLTRGSEEDEFENVFGQHYPGMGSLVSYSSFNIDSGGFEEEEETIIYEPSIKEIVIDRSAYIEEYNKLLIEHTALRRKNGYLQKKMFEHYNKRKIYNVFDELSTNVLMELMPKYEHKMEELYELKMNAKQNQVAVLGEIDYMKSQRDDRLAELNTIFESMLKREKEVATGLIFTKTGKALSDKVIDRFIQRQRAKCEVMSTIRLTYLKRRDKVREMETLLKEMENVGGTLDIMRYEQLEIEHQNHSDKLEERDEELSRLREKFSHTIHTLGHIREKISHVDDSITETIQENDLVHDELTNIRETVNYWKTQRDENRNKTGKFVAMSGLLTFKPLLKDMEKQIGQLEKEKELLATLKGNYKLFSQRQTAIMKNIEQLKMLAEKRKKAVHDSLPVTRRNRSTANLSRVR